MQPANEQPERREQDEDRRRMSRDWLGEDRRHREDDRRQETDAALSRTARPRE